MRIVKRGERKPCHICGRHMTWTNSNQPRYHLGPCGKVCVGSAWHPPDAHRRDCEFCAEIAQAKR